MVITYFATKHGYLIEFYDRGLLVEYHRVMESGATQPVFQEMARLEAAELAALKGLHPSAPIYDHAGQEAEDALFG